MINVRHLVADLCIKINLFLLPIACAVEFDDQHCGIYAGDADSYKIFAEVFDPIIEEYHGLPAGFKHTSDMDVTKINGNIMIRCSILKLVIV